MWKDGNTNKTPSHAAAPTQKAESFLENLYSGWTEWVSKHRLAASLVVIGILACLILVAVVPPVCVLHGCGLKQAPEEMIEDLPLNRLLVEFDEIGKTVKSKVSPLLYDYFEESILTFGVNIVTFTRAKVLNQVQRILESQPDVLRILRDRPQYKVPEVDPYLGVQLHSEMGNGTLRRRWMQALMGGANKKFEEYEQWALYKVAAEEAWNYTQGEQVVVAVIDTGCDLMHKDLKGNFWVNSREIPDNGVDDDKNGKIDDVYGYDFAGPCENITGPECGPRPSPQDSVGHGSHCSGIIGAVQNGLGIIGVAPNVKIMCLKVTPNNGEFYTSRNLEAIDYAINNGAHIISCSFGPKKPIANPTGPKLQELMDETEFYSKSIKAIEKKGMLLVAAAGNEAENLDGIPYYNPCSLVKAFPNNVLCVMATDDEDKRLVGTLASQGSNYGNATVSVAAPGLQIVSTIPSIPKYNFSSYINMSGTSMATPLVAGVAALITSILGKKDNNMYKGPQAGRILLESSDIVLGLEVAGKRRINADEAVQSALMRIDGVIRLKTKNFSVPDQSAIMEGFTMTYYNSTSKYLDPSTIVVETTMASSVAHFSDYSINQGTLNIRAYMYLPKRGSYLFFVNTSANPSNLTVLVGEQEFTQLNQTYLLGSIGAWYTLDITYVNPVAPIDIFMSEPNSGEPPVQHLRGIFFIASSTPPRDFYYAPNIALSSAWQVLARSPAVPLAPSSILTSQLQLDQPYNFSAVVPDLNFTAAFTQQRAVLSTANINQLQAALGLPAGSGPLVGIAHTRLRAPEEDTSGACDRSLSCTVRFRVSCELCALYINGLQVVDGYDSIRWLQPVTRDSRCVALGRGPSNQLVLHDLVLRFAIGNTSAGTTLSVSWLPCKLNETTPRSLRPHIMNNLFWQPSSGIAGYVSGMQCDMWRDVNGGEAKPWLPLVKFRLPTALAQTKLGSENRLINPSATEAVYSVFNNNGCSANETLSRSTCAGAAGFQLSDLVNKGAPVNIEKNGDESATLRCWTFVNAGFRSGSVQTLKPMGIKIYLGTQKILDKDFIPSRYSPPMAPNITTLGDYYQLLAIDIPTIRYDAAWGIVNGTGGEDLVRMDLSRTLLPIPLLGSGAAANSNAAVTAGSVRYSLHHRRELLLTSALDPAAENQQQYDPTYEGKISDIAEIDEGSEVNKMDGNHHRFKYHHRIARRGLQQQSNPSQRLYTPTYLGASLYSAGWSLPQASGLCGITFPPDSEFNTATLSLDTVFYNVSIRPGGFTGSKCENPNVGLSDVACPRINSTLPRIAWFPGFMKVPVSSATSCRDINSATSGILMCKWALRVVDEANMTTAINVGDVTVRNGVEYTPNVLSSETSIWLPYNITSGAVLADHYLPTVVTARSKGVRGYHVAFNLSLVTPGSRVLRVNSSLWFCDM